MCMEMMDEMLVDLFGIHFLEPICTFEERTKIRPIINKKYKDANQTQTPSYLLSLDKRMKPKQLNDKASMDLLDKRRLFFDRAPKLPVVLKLEVAKFPVAERGHAQETAEVLEEILRQVEMGQMGNLLPRKMYGPGG